MERAVLADDSAAVDGDHLPVGEGLRDEAEGLGVEVGLVVGRAEYCPVDDEEIGIGGRQTIPHRAQTVIRLVDRSRHGKSEQTVGTPLDGTERLELFLHEPEFDILLVVRIVAAHI